MAVGRVVERAAWKAVERAVERGQRQADEMD